MGGAWRTSLAGGVCLALSGLLVGTGGPTRLFAGPTAEARAPIADDPDLWAPAPSRDAGSPADSSGALLSESPEACAAPTVGQTASIALGEAGATPACVVVGAGDLVTWLNQTTAPLVLVADSDEFASEDASAVFAAVAVPPLGRVTVRMRHAGRVAYAASGQPGVGGTILVIGRGAA